MRNPEMQPPLIESGQNDLTITIGDRNIVVPRKELYGIPDIGNAIGSHNHSYIHSKLSRARKNNPDINPQHLGTGTRPRTLFFSEEDFVLAVTAIIPTIRRKGVETRPKGYTLKKDQEQKADALTLFLQTIFDNKTDLKELVTGGPGKTSILERAKQQLNSFDPQEKIRFLKNIFAILSNPDRDYQNKRDCALELLNIMDLKSIDPKELTETYRKAVYNLQENLNQDSDPCGEIDALLEAGKIIAPFIKKNGNITRAWKLVADVFKGDGSDSEDDRQKNLDRQKILNDIEEIRQLISKTLSEFDTKVLISAQRGLRNQQIAAELRVKIKDIQRSKYRIKNKGRGLKPSNRPEGK